MIFSCILVSRVEAPVVALVPELTTEGAAAGCPWAARRGRDRWQVQQGQVQLAGRLADLSVRVALGVAVHEEDPGDRAGQWLRCPGRGHPCFPLGRRRIGAEPRRRGRVGGVRWDVDRVPADVADGLRVPEALAENVPFAHEGVHLVVEPGDVRAEGVPFALEGVHLGRESADGREHGVVPAAEVGLARGPLGCRELVAAEGALPFPELAEAPLAGHVAALHDCGICVGEGFQTDATLRRRGSKGLQDQPADVRVDHCVLVPMKLGNRPLNKF